CNHHEPFVTSSPRSLHYSSTLPRRHCSPARRRFVVSAHCYFIVSGRPSSLLVAASIS
ncbi:hypothetical protein PIB30_103176, partial [Stylosanthes scabra]|nr:hypothetical protein [Stylosanthes scabra]